jgi:CMP-N,N'-diacetyllegionaminic acid synthase
MGRTESVSTETVMKVLGIVPARAGSKRVPRKNVRMLEGLRLIDRVLAAAVGAHHLTRIVVSSDDDEVLSAVTPHDPKRVIALRRPAELSDDASPSIDYVRHALAASEPIDGRYDAVCICQVSSPLTLSSDIDATVALWLRTQAGSAVSVVEVAHDVHPVKLKRMEGERLLPFFEDERGRMSSAQLPQVFVRNCAVYVTRRDQIDAGMIVTDDSVGHVMPRQRSIDINDELDFAFCEFLCQRATP